MDVPRPQDWLQLLQGVQVDQDPSTRKETKLLRSIHFRPQRTKPVGIVVVLAAVVEMEESTTKNDGLPEISRKKELVYISPSHERKRMNTRKLRRRCGGFDKSTRWSLGPTCKIGLSSLENLIRISSEKQQIEFYIFEIK